MHDQDMWDVVRLQPRGVCQHTLPRSKPLLIAYYCHDNTIQVAEEMERETVLVLERELDLVRFTCIARWDEEEKAFFVVGEYTDTELDFQNIANEILQQLNQSDKTSTASQFETTLGFWYVKCLPDGFAYIISTSKEYPPCVAIECIDELSTSFERARKKSATDRPTPTECCQEILETFDTLEENSLPWRLLYEIDDSVRNPYDEHLIAMMQQQITQVQEQLHANILGQLDNIEDAETLQKKSDNLLLQAAVFKKNASKLPRKTFLNKKRVWVTAAGALAGAGVGLAMGGVGSPAAVPAGVAFAEGIEMAAAAMVFGVGSNVMYYWAKQRWFAYQKRFRLDLSRIRE